MAKPARPVRRLEERLREQDTKPETDTRPRYGDGTLHEPGDLVVHTSAPTGEPCRVFYVTRTQDVPVAYHATVDVLGRVQLSHLALVRRGRLTP